MHFSISYNIVKLQTYSSWYMLEELYKVDDITDGKLVNLENINEDIFHLMHVYWSNKIGFKPKLRNYTKI